MTEVADKVLNIVPTIVALGVVEKTIKSTTGIKPRKIKKIGGF